MPNKKQKNKIPKKQKARQEEKSPYLAKNDQLFSSVGTPFVFPMQESMSLIQNNEHVGHCFSKIAKIFSGLLSAGVREWSIKRDETADRLHKILYLALADMKSFVSVGTRNIKKDYYLQEMLLHRLAHVVNLECIYFSKLREIVDFYCDPEYQDELIPMLFQILPKAMHDYHHTPDFVPDFLRNMLSLYDYLPENKFRVLFIHPLALWSNGKYDDYKENTREEIIKEKLHSLYSLQEQEIPCIDKLTIFILNLRKEMIACYELLAETDRELLHYCDRKKYTAKDLFDINKRTILAALNTCDAYNLNCLNPLQENTGQSIQLKKQTVDECDSWLKIFEEGPGWDLQFNANNQDNLRFITQDPNSMLDFCFSIFMGLNVDEVGNLLLYISNQKNAEAIIQGIATVMADAGKEPSASEFLIFLKPFIPIVFQYLEKLRNVQKQGAVHVRFFILDCIQSLQSNFLFNSLPAKIGLSLSRLETTLSSTKLNLCCQQGNFKLAKPILDEVMDVFPLLMTAIQYNKGFFANQILEYFIKRKNEWVCLVPETAARQFMLLNSVFLLFKTDEKSSKAMLLKLLDHKSKWEFNTIQKLIEETDNVTLKPILEAYVYKQSLEKAGRSKRSFFAQNAMEFLGVEAAAEEKEDAAAVAEDISPVGEECSLNANPTDKLRVFSAGPFSPGDESLHCNALALVFLQYAQAYLNTRQDNYLDSLTLNQARCFRHALVHQFQPDAGSYSLLLDGEGENVITLAKVLLEAIERGDATELVADKLFCKALAHGSSLQAQMNRGEREYVKLCQRIIFTRWLNASYFSLEDQARGKTIRPEVLEHAKAMLTILRQLYCLRQGGCSGEEVDHALAKSIRHLPDRLPPKPQQPLLGSEMRVL